MRIVWIIFLACGLFGAVAIQPAQALEIGIDRSNLAKESEAIQQQTLRGIHDLHAKWFRDAISFSSPDSVPRFVDELRLVKQNNLKMLAIVLPSYLDYDKSFANAEESQKLCGWRGGSGKLSEINLTKFSEHLRALLGAAKAAKLTIDAFEIGNEFDTTCYDADVPVGHPASEAEIQSWLRGYGEFLKAAVLVIHEAQYFPEAKIVTFGIAHGSDQWDNPRRHLSHPARIVARLRNVNGFNYLDNSLYHVDGYGTHIYPWPNDIDGSITRTLRDDVAGLGRDKPLWLTEWGFLDQKAFPNKGGQSLNQCLQQFLETLDGLHAEIPIGPGFFYRYDVWLSDPAGKPLPLAKVLSDYAARRKSP